VPRGRVLIPGDRQTSLRNLPEGLKPLLPAAKSPELGSLRPGPAINLLAPGQPDPACTRAFGVANGIDQTRWKPSFARKNRFGGACIPAPGTLRTGNKAGGGMFSVDEREISLARPMPSSDEGLEACSWPGNVASDQSNGGAAPLALKREPSPRPGLTARNTTPEIPGPLTGPPTTGTWRVTEGWS